MEVALDHDLENEKHFNGRNKGKGYHRKRNQREQRSDAWKLMHALGVASRLEWLEHGIQKSFGAMRPGS